VLLLTWLGASLVLSLLFYLGGVAVPPLIPLVGGMVAGAILWPV
jgi:hypothetical protein